MDALPFAEGKIVIDIFNKKLISMIGEETEEDKKSKVTAAIEAKKKPEVKKEEEQKEFLKLKLKNCQYFKNLANLIILQQKDIKK